MVVGAFPLAKLGVLAIRQISKPLANRIKEKAKSSHFFRTYICMPPAQIYHWLEITVKMKLLNLGKPSEVPKLNEAMAIELGAELLGETIIFGFAALTITAEYIRQSRKESNKEADQENRLKNLEQSLENMQQTIELQSTTIDELTRKYNDVKQKSTIGKLIEEGKRQITGTSNLESNSASHDNASSIVPKNQGLINYAIFDVTNYFGLKQLCTTETKSVEDITYISEPCFTCEVCSRLGLDYPLSQKTPVHETFHSRKEIVRHGFVHKALTDALLVVRGNPEESSKCCTLKLSKPSQKAAMYAELKYPRILTEQSQSLLHQSITSASECIIGKIDTRKFEFDSQFLTAVDFADEIDGNILYDFNLVEIADDASSVFLGESGFTFSNLNSKFSSSTKYRINKYRDHQVKSAPGIFEQALYDAVGCIVEN